MIVIIYTLRDGIFLSITHFSRHVEAHLQVGGGNDPFRQLQLGPAKLLYRPDVPRFLLEGQLRLQNDHVLGPADGHGLRHHFRGLLIGTVEIPHPPQISRREPRNVGMGGVQILSGGHCRAFLRPAADQTANLSI